MEADLAGASRDGVVRAAGGVVWRPAAGGETVPEIVLIRRPRYGDWSLPKGKLDPGESWQQAAVREVGEETGLTVEVGDYLDEVEYLATGTSDGTDGRVHRKVVRYWAMRALAEPAAGPPPGAEPEVDEVRWVPGADAAGILTYDHDRTLVRAFLARRDGSG